LDLAVFILCMETAFSFIMQERTRRILAAGLCLLLLASAWYNINRQFVDPLRIELAGIKNFVDHVYGTGTKTIYVIRPREDAFTEKYGIARSWDEFGKPSNANTWTSEPLIRQLIFEKTGDRQIAESVVIKSWPDRESFSKSGKSVSDSVLLIDVQGLFVGGLGK
jgi:hypothetical protein